MRAFGANKAEQTARNHAAVTLFRLQSSQFMFPCAETTGSDSKVRAGEGKEKKRSWWTEGKDE